MTIGDIVAQAQEFVNTSKNNYICDSVALSRECAGMKIFDSPILAFGCPDDEIYLEFKSPDVVGDDFLLPLQWLESAKTIISFFLPYTQQVKSANSRDFQWPADEWLHARYDGQLFLKEFALFLQTIFEDAGAKCIIPSFDDRFKIRDIRDKTSTGENKFSSSWSERHVAYACGLGTFGISKGLITDKGICGRFGSILTELNLEKNTRPYNNIYEYCCQCGACVKTCPVGAISAKESKNDLLCAEFIDKTYERHNPRYGCGKCQVGVPCESKIPCS